FHLAAHPFPVFVYVHLPLLRTVGAPLSPHIVFTVQADTEGAVGTAPIWVEQKSKLALDILLHRLTCQWATIPEPRFKRIHVSSLLFFPRLCVFGEDIHKFGRLHN